MFGFQGISSAIPQIFYILPKGAPRLSLPYFFAVMKKKNRIFIDQWLDFKPYRRYSPTDRYYLQLSNRVYETLRSSPLSFQLAQLLDEQDDDATLAELSCFLTAYFEDVISGTRLWQTFVQEHSRLYGKKLPFFEPGADYEPEEINEQDVQLLIWYFLNVLDEDYFLNPYLELFANLAQLVMEVFEEAWEDAPENELLKSYYQLPADADYFAARAFMDGVFYKSYLFFPDTGTELLRLSIELSQDNDDPQSLPLMVYELRDRLLHEGHTRLLAYRAKEWAAALLGPMHPLHKAIAGLSHRVQGFFLYKSQDATHIRLEHIASQREFLLYKPSFDHAHSLKTPDTLVYISMVEWQQEWWFSGIHFQEPYDPTIVAQERSSLESKQQVAFLDHSEGKTAEILEKQHRAFLDFNGGSLIAFMPTSQMDQFNRDFIEYYTQSLQLSESKKSEAYARAKAEGFSGDLNFSLGEDLSEEPEDAVFFFNPKVGGEMVFGMNSAFPDPANPFYREEESTDSLDQLLMGKAASTELVLYCVEHYGDKLPYFQEGRGMKYRRDLDFLLRFWKSQTYPSSPAFVLSGRSQE
jgi:hypothetical protein